MNGPVWMIARIQYHAGDLPEVEVCEPVWLNARSLERHTPAEVCANVIAATRNIAATWDIVGVELHMDEHDWVAVDVTEAVKDAYDKLYVVRRPEFSEWSAW